MLILVSWVLWDIVQDVLGNLEAITTLDLGVLLGKTLVIGESFNVHFFREIKMIIKNRLKLI